MRKLLLGILISLTFASAAFAWPGPSVRDGWNYNYIVTATTTVIKSGPGLLHTLNVTGGTTGTIIVYDNTAASGSIIASYSTTNAPATYTFDVAFATGLTVITSAATQLTVSYK